MHIPSSIRLYFSIVALLVIAQGHRGAFAQGADAKEIVVGREDADLVRLTGIYHNLIRYWAEV